MARIDYNVVYDGRGRGGDDTSGGGPAPAPSPSRLPITEEEEVGGTTTVAAAAAAADAAADSPSSPLAVPMMPAVPISCGHDAGSGMFRVTSIGRGKALHSGGFGVSLPVTTPTTPTMTASGSTSAQHLFPEEALFLHERGLLRVDLSPPEATTTGRGGDDGDGDAAGTGTTPATTGDLYGLLDRSDVPLAAYLTYSHLRCQSYIVLRHDPLRRWRRSYRCHRGGGGGNDAAASEGTEGKGGGGRSGRKRRRGGARGARRKDAVDSLPPPPRILALARDHRDGDGTGGRGDDGGSIAFDVYAPDSNFRKTDPGRPDFSVAVSRYGGAGDPARCPTFDGIRALLGRCGGDRGDVVTDDGRGAEGDDYDGNGRGGDDENEKVVDATAVPLRIAAVSDSGTVVMFAVAEAGVPSLH